MTHASVPAEQRTLLGITDNLIRLSVGIEDEEVLVADIEQALANAVSVTESLVSSRPEDISLIPTVSA